MDSNSSDETSVSEFTSESSDDDGMEAAQVNGTRLLLPQGLCEKRELFKEFFSHRLWNSLSDEHKQHLQTFLPNFPENDEEEKRATLQRLFNFETFKFSNPLETFHEHLKAGYFRPDIAKMRKLIRRAEEKEAKCRYKNHKEKLKNAILESRKRLLCQVRSLPPGYEPKVEKVNAHELDLIRHRTKRRYFQILASIRSKTEDLCSSDENYLDNSLGLPRKHKRHLNSMKSTLHEQKFSSTITGTSSSCDLERYITPNCNPFYVNEETYRNLIKNHRKRKQACTEDPELWTRNVTLSDVIHRTQLPHLKLAPNPVQYQKSAILDLQKLANRKRVKKEIVQPVTPTLNSHSENENTDSDSIIVDAVTVAPSPRPKKIEITKQSVKPIVVPKPQPIVKPVEVKSEPEETVALQENSTQATPNVISNYSQYGKIMPVTLSDLEGIDMMNLPIDLDNSDIDILEVNNKPELMQETHSNFLSLIRDVICSTSEHRMDFQTLEKRLQTWQESPISPLNDWYSMCESWVVVLKSAVNFLCGNCTELPNDFVPYLEYKQMMNAYQWIGAGRDSDNLLAPLCKFWLEHRDELKTVKVKEEVDVELSDRTQTPPPPRYPTTWTLRKATSEEIEIFREQERRRYENPHRAFTYCCHGYESVVAPLKGIYNPAVGNAKARGHTILTADRPNFVTILSLVRDAMARLPNGEGTRGDIVELLKHSQYISPNATDSVLQTVVSGALDRMHTQFDPCVKYDTKRKIWIYLHRNRSEEDFERIHQHLQGVTKVAKKTPKRSPTKLKSKQPDKTKIAKENNITTPQENPTDKQSHTQQVKVAKKIVQSLNVPHASPKSNSLLISNNLLSREPSPPTIQILEQPSNSPRSQHDLLDSLTEARIASPKPTKPKGLVKILSPQHKSIVVPQNHVQIKLEKAVDDMDKSIKSPMATNIKNVKLLRTSSPQQELQNVTLSMAKPEQPQQQQHVIQPTGIQIKTPNNLTPAQQQQILQTIKQKIIPQTVQQQQQLMMKHKIAQKQGQGPTVSLLGHTAKLNPVDNTLKPGMVTNPSPVVAKVLTNAAGQVISVESLLAHQKQHGSLPQGTTLRVSGTKAGQSNIIHLTGGPNKQNAIAQFAVASQNNLIALTTQPKLVAATPSATSATSSITPNKPSSRERTAMNRAQQVTKLPSKVTQQLINAKIIQNIEGQKVMQPKLLVNPNSQVKLTASNAVAVSKNQAAQQKSINLATTSNPSSIRMVNATNLNLTQIGGKPVFLTSKGGTLQGHNVILQGTPTSTGSPLVLKNAAQSAGNINLISPQNVVLTPQVKISQQQQQQAQVVFKNSSVGQTSQGHIVLGGQQVRLQTGAATPQHATAQRLVLASQGQGGQIVAQQILLPAGFQGTAINIKALQGVKVIPIAQAQNKNVQSRQVFARVMNPTAATKAQQNHPKFSEKTMDSTSQEDT